MPIYQWVAVTKRGRKLKGELDAANEKIALSQLKKRNLAIKKFKLKPKDLLSGLSFMKPKVTKKDLVIFTRQFSTMIDAGLPLVQGLQILSEQAENPTFKAILKEINRDVEGGSTLAEAMKKHPEVFDNLFVNLVAAGEVGGILDTILRRLAGFIEKAEKLKSPDQGGHDLPHRGGGDRHHRHRRHPDLRHPRFRRHVQGLWKGPAGADSDRGQHEPVHERQLSLCFRRRVRDRFRVQEVQGHDRRQEDDRLTLF